MNYRYELPCSQPIEDCSNPEMHGKDTVHHICPRRFGKAAVLEAMRQEDVKRARLIRAYIESPFNKALVCRCMHDILDAHPEELPPDHTMKRRLDSPPYSLEDARNGEE